MKAIHLSRKEDPPDGNAESGAVDDQIFDTPMAKMVLTNFIRYIVF